MPTSRMLQKELLNLMKRLKDRSVPLDDVSRKALYHNLWDLYETREEKARNSRLTLEERLVSIVKAGMTPFIVCTSCGRSSHYFEGSVEVVKQYIEEPCWKCKCEGNKVLMGDPDAGEFK